MKAYVDEKTDMCHVVQMSSDVMMVSEEYLETLKQSSEIRDSDVAATINGVKILVSDNLPVYFPDLVEE